MIRRTGPTDVSAEHIDRDGTNYDPRCGWCWLNANHSTDEHARKVAETIGDTTTTDQTGANQ